VTLSVALPDHPLPVSGDAAAAAAGEAGNDVALDHGEVPVVPALEDSAEKLDAASDDDADDEELAAPGNSAAGLSAAPPSHED
jgi:hypothetical protein